MGQPNRDSDSVSPVPSDTDGDSEVLPATPVDCKDAAAPVDPDRSTDSASAPSNPVLSRESAIAPDDPESGKSSSAAPATPKLSRGAAIARAACLTLFPLTFILLSNTGIHPGFAGTAAEQVAALAADAVRWRWVHAGLAGGSLLGMGVLFILKSLLPRPHPVVHAAMALGVAGSAVLTGVFALEATLVVELAQACVSAAESCLSAANGPFLDRFSDLALDRVPLLFPGGGALLAAIMALAVMGRAMRALAFRESLPLTIGALVLFLYGPSLHGPPLGLPTLGLLFVLAGSGALAVRLERASI